MRRLGLGLRRIVMTVACALAGCQQPPPLVAAPDPAPLDGVGYLIFNAPIGAVSRDLLIADIDKLRHAGATEIHLAMNSPGGDIDAAQGIVDYMVRVHDQDGVTFKAYNIGLVASAATYVFLNAQDRYSAPQGAFLFHAAGAVSTGPVNAQNLRDQADKLDAYERVVRATLKARTRLNDSETQTYVRRTVVLTSDDARRDGIVDGIATFAVPKGTRTWVITAKPLNGKTAPVPVATSPPG